MMKVRITDTTLRDAHQSLLATRLRTRDMIPVTERLDLVGFFSLEVWGGATFDSCIRFLNEDPWDRLRQLRKHITHTPLQMLLRGQNLVGYKHYPDDVVDLFIRKAVDNGIQIFRVFDALNDMRNMELAIKVVKREGAHAQGAISYTISPVHSIDRYVETARNLSQLGCDSICIKDMAGLISPHATRDLVEAIRREVDLPISLHSHCTCGMAPMSYYAACEAGASILDTAMSPFAWGASQPPTESMVAALQGTEFDTGLNVELLTDIKRYFEDLRAKYNGLVDRIAERVDTSALVHQIPGGMLSNLVSQLKEQNALDKYDAVLREVPRVRAEMGYPPLVTPTSQIVGTQAVFNVLTNERYKIVPQEVKDYFRGLYGRPPAPVDEVIKRAVIGDEEVLPGRPADSIPPQLDLLRVEARELGIGGSDEELLTYALYPTVGLKFLRGEAKEEDLTPTKADREVTAEKISAHASTFIVEVDGEIFDVKVIPLGEMEIAAKPESTHRPVPAAGLDGGVLAPMQGLVMKLRVQVGDPVQKGDIVAVIEAMKMQNNVLAHGPGIIQNVFVSEGQTVQANAVLMVIK